jgi:multiple antibiotic resistance protein
LSPTRIAPSHQAKDRIVNEISNAFLLVFAGLFPVVNPLGAAPLFLSLTADCTPQQRKRLALLVAFNSFWLLVGSTLFGSLILEFSISIPVVRVAGGMLVTAMGVEAAQRRRRRRP